MTEQVAAGGGDPGYPVVLSLAGRRCLVVGGGPVAARKARGLLEGGAHLTVVALRLSPAMQAVVEGAPGGRTHVEPRPYRPGEAAGFEFVVSATGDQPTDRRVATDALAGGGLVNAGGLPDLEDVRAVQLPAVHRLGPVTVAASTGGQSPVLAAWVRDRIAEMPWPDLTLLCALLAAARSGRQQAAGRDAVDWSAEVDHLVALVSTGRIEEARAALGGLGHSAPSDGRPGGVRPEGRRSRGREPRTGPG